MSLPDGKRKSYYGETRDEAQKKMRRGQRDIDAGLPIVGDKQTVDQFLSTWLETAKQQLKPGSFHRYETNTRLHILPVIGKHALSKLTPQHVQALYTQKMESGLSSTTVRQIHLILHRALKDAQRMGLVQRNVTEMVRPPRTRKIEMKTLDARQVDLFFEAVANERLEALFVLAVTTGMRQGELLGLRWQDVDVDKGVLHINRTLYMRGGSIILSEPKTLHSKRTIHLTKLAIYALRKHRIKYLQEALAFGPTWNAEYNLVFPTSTGNPILASHLVEQPFHRVLKKAGLPMIRFHDLRHTAATLMLEHGINPKVVSEILGHSDIAITLGVYGHITPRMQQMAMEAIDKLFS